MPHGYSEALIATAMRCPHCETENREDRAACYHCGRDLTLLRLIWNKAKSHFNTAVKYAEEGHYYEALGELNAAIELNSQMIEAHVLRGTILARLERTGEARESLRKALSLRPNAARAHRYLRELGELERATPLLRRLRITLATAAGAAALFLIVAVSMLLFRGPAEDDPARLGWAALQRGDLAEGRHWALSVTPEQERNELLRAISLAVETRLDAAGSLSRAGRHAEALGMLASLEESRLPEDLRSAIARERAHIRGRMADEFRALAERTTLADIDTLHAERDRLAALLPEAGEDAEAILRERIREELQAYQSQLAALDNALERGAPASEIEKLLAQAEQEWLPDAQWAERAEVTLEHDYRAAFAERRGQLRARQAERRAEELYGEAMAAAREDDQRLYEQTLAALRELEPPQPEVLEKAEGLRTLFVERQRVALMDGLREALAQGDTRRAVELAEAVARLGATLDPETQERIDEARRVLATDSYYALMQRASQIEEGDLAPEDAREVLRLVQRARGPLPPRIAARAHENLHYFAAIAHKTLGNEEAAEQEIEALRRDYPGSAWLLPGLYSHAD